MRRPDEPELTLMAAAWTTRVAAIKTVPMIS